MAKTKTWYSNLLSMSHLHCVTEQQKMLATLLLCEVHLIDYEPHLLTSTSYQLLLVLQKQGYFQHRLPSSARNPATASMRLMVQLVKVVVD